MLSAGLSDGLSVAYCVPEFPSQTHAFFWREARALEAQGVTVHFISTRRPAEDACPHAFAAAARARTHYVFPPRSPFWRHGRSARRRPPPMSPD